MINHPMVIFFNVIHSYGYAGLIVLLALGVVGLPLPDETILVVVGVLISQRKMDYSLSILSASFGSAVGITISYIVGNFVEHSVITKLIKPFRLTGSRFLRVQNYMNRYGKWLIFGGYFIPGVRHLTALIAGLSEMKFRAFALPAYFGAVVWTALFITLGRVLGHGIHKYEHIVQKITWDIAYSVIGLGVMMYIAVVIWKKKRKK